MGFGIQPWCYHLTGTPGKAPAYDMCQYVIENAINGIWKFMRG
ncbi:MAG: hypothetical protein ACLSG8_09860 [Barnesiella sp.]